MLRNPPHNLPPDFNQNFASFSLGAGQSNYGQFQEQRPAGTYSTNLSMMPWQTPEDLQQTYQHGHPIVRQFNNSVIDDYYKKFLRPITDYVAIPTNGQPTYVYQNLTTNGQLTSVQQTADQSNGYQNPVSQLVQAQKPTDYVEEKKHKKKHKKKSSSKLNGELKTEETSNNTLSIADQKQETTDQDKQSETLTVKNASDTHHTDRSSSKKKSSSSKSHKRSSSGPIPQHTSSAANPIQTQHSQPQQVEYQQQVPPAQQFRYQPPIDPFQKMRHIVQPTAPPTVNYGPSQASLPMKNEMNPVVYFEIEIDDDPRGRLVMELFQHALPRTAQNFLALTTNQLGYGYRLSYFHRIIPGFMAQAGDFERSDGTGGYSIYGDKFEDEGFMFRHDRPGLLSMANSGPHTNGSQFFVTFVPCPHLDNKHVVFGQLIQGFHLLKDLEMSGSDGGEVTREVKIADSGRLQ
ncbi:unnamed protein product [Didymodactylos carnosus]|uniref:peptidylprolyl isomerase n=1 Tax=Didymodactylos carnosus TaxID=1234261 RepID=A0A814Y0P1_9BILA|nr:unnamed protein product [Didymodactylos carnosus]CAF3986124.1 unnamed protein product [Didymodactylos carnosus]